MQHLKKERRCGVMKGKLFKTTSTKKKGYSKENRINIAKNKKRPNNAKGIKVFRKLRM
jgi:hypothetical protein